MVNSPQQILRKFVGKIRLASGGRFSILVQIKGSKGWNSVMFVLINPVGVNVSF